MSELFFIVNDLYKSDGKGFSFIHRFYHRRPVMIPVDNKYYLWNDYDLPCVYNGENIRNIKAPNGKYAALRNNRIYLAGDSGALNRVYFSDVGDFESWGRFSFIDICDRPGDITGLACIGDDLIIFKEGSAWRLSGNDWAGFYLSCIEVGIVMPPSLLVMGV